MKNVIITLLMVVLTIGFYSCSQTEILDVEPTITNESDVQYVYQGKTFVGTDEANLAELLEREDITMFVNLEKNDRLVYVYDSEEEITEDQIRLYPDMTAHFRVRNELRQVAKQYGDSFQENEEAQARIKAACIKYGLSVSSKTPMDASNCRSIMYEHSNYGGDKVGFSSGHISTFGGSYKKDANLHNGVDSDVSCYSSTASQNWGDRISSLKVGENGFFHLLELELFRHDDYDGKEISFLASSSNVRNIAKLSDYKMTWFKTWNDRISSAKSYYVTQ